MLEMPNDEAKEGDANVGSSSVFDAHSTKPVIAIKVKVGLKPIAKVVAEVKPSTNEII